MFYAVLKECCRLGKNEGYVSKHHQPLRSRSAPSTCCSAPVSSRAPGDAAAQNQPSSSSAEPPKRRAQVKAHSGRGLLSPHPPQHGRTAAFAFKWLFCTDYSAEEGQFKTPRLVPFLLHSTPRHLKSGHVSSALLPFCKKSLLSTGFLGFWPPNPPHSSACALGTDEGHLMPTASLPAPAKALPVILPGTFRF